MNQSRFNSIYRGLSVVAKKVYDAVPIEDQWTIQQIVSELGRKGHIVDVKTVGGCIASMVSTGLLMELKNRCFSRVKVKAKEVQEIEDEVPEITVAQNTERVAMQEKSKVSAPTPTIQKQTAIAKLGALSERAVAIGMMLKTLASDIEKAAIEIDDQGAAAEQETQKLKQLKQLLKELG